MRRIQRASAWLLLPLMLLQFLSGYAILHGRLFAGVLDKPTAFRIHVAIQPLTVAAVSIHGLTAVRRWLIRRRIRHPLIDIGLTLIGCALIAASVHLNLRG